MIELKNLAGKYHEQINIDENAIGFSYDKVFSRFLNKEALDWIEVDDAYIKKRHQVRQMLTLT